jgi:Flp pilus assembly protein TadD
MVGAHDALARAIELEPGNVKAISNLALWSMLNGDETAANDIMQRADLPQASRDEVRRLAMGMRVAGTQRPEQAKASVDSVGHQEQAAAAKTGSVPGNPPGTMLERFGSTTAVQKVYP